MKTCFAAIGLISLSLAWAGEPRTEITKWQDGKDACISLTFDDSSINQFRIDVPLLNERHIPGTFFIETGLIEGSKNHPTFVGRPIMDILRESATIPTSKDNWLERTSMLNYLRMVQQVPAIDDFSAQRLGRFIRTGNYAEVNSIVDAALAKLRQTEVTYTAAPRKSPAIDSRYPLTWDEMRRHAAEGHEFANHSINHPFMPAIDEANIVYELEKSNEDMRAQLGAKHTFSVEAPFGIDDPRVEPIVSSRFPLTRNWVIDEFMDGFLRSDTRDPAISKKEYVQWQRGPRADSSLDMMKGWVDSSIGDGFWLVLVFHGIEGIGYEPLPTERMRAYVDYIKEREGRMWIATFQDGAKYARERLNSSVKSKMSGDTIAVTVSHSLDPRLYDLPLTARTAIPADWRLAGFRQGDDVRWLPVHREGGEPFVMYRIAPNGRTAVLEKGSN